MKKYRLFANSYANYNSKGLANMGFREHLDIINSICRMFDTNMLLLLRHKLQVFFALQLIAKRYKII